MAEQRTGHDGRRVLVLGAYGLIGSCVARRLVADGCVVVGLGRDATVARKVMPEIDWIIRDLGDLCEAKAWDELVDAIDVVVNCAGALQQSGNDDLEAVHSRAIAALAAACAGREIGLVQISAAGVDVQASTAFLRTKAAGDAAVRQAGCDYWIFRPGIVLAPTAYGGTELLRMLAAFPAVQPLACPDAMIQTVSADDVGRAVSMAVSGELPAGTECDLVEDKMHSLRDVVADFRQWLGFAPAASIVVVPNFVLRAISLIADGLGLLGWRSPLRSTAVRVLQDGVTGESGPWPALGGFGIASLHKSLRAMPARAEDRRAARMALLTPIVVAVLFVFWLASGVIGLVSLDTAAQVLVDVGWSDAMSRASVVVWSLVDIAIALALLVRRTAAAACWAMVVVSLVYLISSTVLVPQLWLDPLGPLVKVLPAIVLALVGRAMLETR